jgi:platelet-activating factor acetylhydrolase
MQLTESVVAVYYPTLEEASWNPFARVTTSWLPDNKEIMLDGYNRFLQGRFGWVWWIGEGDCGAKLTPVGKLLARVQIPVRPLAPLAADDKFPVVLFSHGLAGTRNTYSQYCSALASEGYVVVAVEHADGSGPAIVRNGKPTPFLKFMETVWDCRTNVMPADVPHTTLTDAHVVMMELRAKQLDFRVREVYDAYSCFERLMRDDSAVVTVDGMDEPTSLLAQLRARVDPWDLHLAGHSFGGGTLLRLMTTAVPDAYAPLPAKHAVLLDPWVEPSLMADPALPNKNVPPPTLVINSEAWTVHEVFPIELSLCRDIGSTVVTIVGLARTSPHLSPLTSDQGFSDFSLLLSNRVARGYLRTIHELTMGALTDTLADVPCMSADADNGNVAITHGKLSGPKGAVLVHSKDKL